MKIDPLTGQSADAIIRLLGLHRIPKAAFSAKPFAIRHKF
jgi:hypothetical protein